MKRPEGVAAWVVSYLIVAVVNAVGCGANEVGSSQGQAHRAYGGADAGNQTGSYAASSEALAMVPQLAAKEDEGAGLDVGSASDRKVIYTATLEVVVENFDGVAKQVSDLVKQHGGYLASANLDRLQGERRSGNWVCRIPVSTFDKFLDAAAGIGVPVTRLQKSQDVSEEFVDLEARIQNKKKLEARITELLGRTDDTIQHVIEVERELARVREDVERMQGRLRYLGDMTAMSTVTVRIREERDYVPPQTPSFSSRLAVTWASSVESARRFGEAVVLMVVALLIPVSTLLVLAGGMYWFVRRFVRGPKRSEPSPAT